MFGQLIDVAVLECILGIQPFQYSQTLVYHVHLVDQTRTIKSDYPEFDG